MGDGVHSIAASRRTMRASAALFVVFTLPRSAHHPQRTHWGVGGALYQPCSCRGCLCRAVYCFVLFVVRSDVCLVVGRNCTRGGGERKANPSGSAFPQPLIPFCSMCHFHACSRVPTCRSPLQCCPICGPSSEACRSYKTALLRYYACPRVPACRSPL